MRSGQANRSERSTISLLVICTECPLLGLHKRILAGPLLRIKDAMEAHALAPRSRDSRSQASGQLRKALRP